jgi:5-methylthioadenosine/S-adenosylhomocysteine deaminase
MAEADLLITNAIVVTMDRNHTILRRGCVATTGSVISTVTPSPALLPEASAIIDARGGIVMPGLINGHTHTPMALFRGVADDLPLDQWLNKVIFPAEARFIAAATVRAGTLLSCAEMLLAGVTTACDGYFLAHEAARAAAEAGMRAVVGQGVIDFPAPGVPDPDQGVAEAARFAARWLPRQGLISPSIFCHSPYTCSAAKLKAAKRAASEKGILFQTHLAETMEERERCLAEHGISPAAYLDRLGILDRDTLLHHCIWIDPEDIDRIAASGAAVCHDPGSNLKLAAGIAPVPDMIAAGIRVALGTDSSASNNRLDLFREMNLTAKLHKVAHRDPTVLAAETVLAMATRTGADAVGLDGITGVLAPGYQADLVVLDASAPNLHPVYSPHSNLVYAAGSDNVRHVLVAGKVVVRDKKLTTIDLDALLKEIDTIATEIRSFLGQPHGN